MQFAKNKTEQDRVLAWQITLVIHTRAVDLNAQVVQTVQQILHVLETSAKILVLEFADQTLFVK